MAPNNKDFQPTKRNKHKCTNCRKRGHPCHKGPGQSCWECYCSPNGKCRFPDDEDDSRPGVELFEPMSDTSDEDSESASIL